MRIGLMLRALDEKGGIGVYTRYLAQELLELDRDNHYIFYYRNAANLGRFAHFDNVTERVVQALNKALWDQIGIPWACWQDKVDVVFHPKFTVPLLAPCKTVMVLHGAGWFLPNADQYWTAMDLKYIKMVMPLYCKKAAAIISVSQLTTDTFNRVLNLPSGKIKTIYFSPGKHFERVVNQAVLETVRKKYNLPDQFIFTLTGYDRGPRKNIEGILKAYEIHHGKTPHKLVIGGKDCHRFRTDYAIPDNGYGKAIVFPGWIEQEDLPAVYSLADLFLFPSHVEGFGIPVVEALKCGTPVIISNDNALKEIAGNAALTVNPDKPEEMASTIARLLSDRGLQSSLSAKGLARAKMFSWENCAQEILITLESLIY